MNPSEILSKIENAEPYSVFHRFTAPLNIPFLTSTEYRVIFEKSDVQPDQIASALSHLSTFPASFRNEVAQAIYNSCLQSFADCACDFDTPQAQLDYEKDITGHFPAATVPQGPQDVWALVKLIDIGVRGQSRRAKANGPTAVVHFNAAWDGEYGISLSFPTGRGDFVVGSLND